MAEVIIDQVRDQHAQERDPASIGGLMIHRVGVNLKTGVVIGFDAVSICNAFIGMVPQWESVAKVTGYQNAYTVYVGGGCGPSELDGKIWQALPLDEVGHHARRFSRGLLGVGLIGDFRVRPPSAKQWHAAIDVCGDLCLMLGIKPSRVFGHGEVGGPNDPKKNGQPGACPGDLFSMTTFRLELATEMAAKISQDAKWRLEATGLRLI